MRSPRCAGVSRNSGTASRAPSTKRIWRSCTPCSDAGRGLLLEAMALLLCALPAAAAPAAVEAYLESLARPDGGCAWEGHPGSHLSPTFAAIGCYHALGRMPPNRRAVADFVRTHHPARLKRLEQEHREFAYQQIQGLVWLGEDASSFEAEVRGWRRPSRYLPQYERHGYPIFRFELAAFTCRKLLGLPLDDLSQDFVAYLDARRRRNGSFNNTPASDGGDGHVLNTWWGLQALRVLGRDAEMRDETIAWLRACQIESGGFTWQPRPAFAGVDDVAYTWAAVRALALLGSAPAAPDRCDAYLRSLANPDGGFGDRPGWGSRPMATYYALDALAALGTLDRPAPRREPPRPRRVPLPEGLHVFSIQLEAHGRGSPSEAVDLARALRIHLWGAKNAAAGWIPAAQAIADAQGVPVLFFPSDEEYGTWVDVPGLGTYSHASDIIAPPKSDPGPSLAGPASVSWDAFRDRRLAPLRAAGGRLIWQFGENEELVRLFLDDSLLRGGFAAISTFHFGNPDFTNSEPFLSRYRGRIPFVALQDAHGEEPWWFADMTAGFRTLFLAAEPTWAGWIDALERNRVAAVRRDAASGHETWMHGGSEEVLDFVRRYERQWRWWDNPDIRRPLVSIVAVGPEDAFEAARPRKGAVIRVRCAWTNTTQGLPKEPLAELVRLVIDGEEVTPALVERKRGDGKLADRYHQVHLPDPAPGAHRVEAVVREIDGGAERIRIVKVRI
ncbi:MAG: terpene cyclase/mutase family protein [Planctomycetes bacterium]|nr:terpene cyclase/mutase family protein [Planctomycetota bacterium]